MMFGLGRVLAAGLISLGLLLTSVAFGESESVADFELLDNNGTQWRLADYAGQPKIIMFWATWCPHCKKLFPTIQTLQEKYGDQGLKIVAVSAFDNGDTQAYAQEYGLTMDIVVGGDELAKQLGIPGTPTVLVLDGDNNIIHGEINPDPEDDTLEQASRYLLGLE